MSGRLYLCQYIGNCFRVFAKPERDVSMVSLGDRNYIPERTCKMQLDIDLGMFKCSNCGKLHIMAAFHMKRNEWNYCPNCGARVVEEIQ